MGIFVSMPATDNVGDVENLLRVLKGNEQISFKCVGSFWSHFVQLFSEVQVRFFKSGE
jgi:hypothetical protein